ncbi:MAG: Ig-like domain-containing protein [Clostridiales bacterium]|nr:Ig-like domain-containing protein [Clostridiales bacterium]
MKKATKRLLSVGLCAALALSVGCGLAACGGDDGKTDPTPTAVPYWLAGTIKATPEWDNVTDANRFSATDNANIFEIKLDMWKGDTFKVRYEGKEWGQFQLNWDNSYDATQKADEDAKIGPDTTSITGQYNYLVKEEGNYTIKLDVSGTDPVVSYVYNGEATEKAPKQITKITLDQTEKSLEVGQSFKLTATIEPADADDPSVEWYSSEEDYATVDAEGNVTAVAAGKTTITVCSAADEEILATCEVTVVAAGQLVAVESIALNKTETTLHAGGNETLTATVTPANATGSVAYTSSDDEIATVDANGKITAVKPGTATITAAQGGKTATCEVTVAKDYYLRGSVYNGWAEVGAVGVQGVIYFTETETAGIYKTASVEIKKNAEFQVAIVAQDWTDAITNSALPAEGDTLTYFAAEGQSNIKALTSGMYTITLDLTGDAPVFTAVQDSPLSDDITAATGLGAWGTAVATGWNGPAAADKVDFVKGENGKWTATLSNVELTAGALQLRWEVEGTTVYGDYRWGDKVTVPTDWEVGTSDITALAGTYNITVTLTASGDVESIVITAAA